jgi:hypothetical protein
VCHVSLPSSYRSRRGHIHLLRVLPLVGCRSKTPTSVHPVPLPRHLAVEILWHNCSDAMHRWCVGSSDAEDPTSKSPLLAFTQPSDRPTLHLDQGVRSSGVEGFVLARLCLNSNWASHRPTVFPLRPLDHPVLLSSLLFLCNSSDATKKWTVGSSNGTWGFTMCTNSSDDCTDACYIEIVGSSDGVFSFPFLLGFDPRFSHFGMWFSCILGT